MADAVKLPFWRTVYDAHVITIENVLTLLRIGWVWVLLLAVADAGLHWFLWPWEEAAIAQGGGGSMSLLLLSTYVWTLFGACVAVPWHRLVLNGEVITAGGLWPLVSDVGRYVAWALVFTLFFFVPAALLIFGSDQLVAEATPQDLNQVTGTDPDVPTWLIVIPAAMGFAAVTALSYVPVRLSLVLPAIALARRDFSAADSWQATRHNFWRLYLGYFLTFAIPLVLIAFMLSLTGFEEVRTREIAVRESLLFAVVFSFAGMMTVTYMSLAYRHLVQDPATMPAQ